MGLMFETPFLFMLLNLLSNTWLADFFIILAFQLKAKTEVALKKI